MFTAFQDERLEIRTVSAIADNGRDPNADVQQVVEPATPFFDISRLTPESKEISGTDVQAILGEAYSTKLKSHLRVRDLTAKPRSAAAAALPVRALQESGPIGPIGEVQAYNYPAGHNPAIQIPLGNDPQSDRPVSDSESVLAIVHCYYLDVAKRILRQLDSLALVGKVLCTTDTEEKKTELQALLS
jgi:hypothetical protein